MSRSGFIRFSVSWWSFGGIDTIISICSSSEFAFDEVGVDVIVWIVDKRCLEDGLIVGNNLLIVEVNLEVCIAFRVTMFEDV